MKQLTIGRSKENDLVIDDPTVSRQHATIVQTDNEFLISDNGSSNGTFINGQRIQKETSLRNNDILKLGTVLVPWRKYFVIDEQIDGGKTKIVQEETVKPVTINEPPRRSSEDTKKSHSVPSSPKRSKTGFVITIVGVILIVLIIAGIGLNYTSNQYDYTVNPIIENQYVDYVEKGLFDKTLVGYVEVANTSNYGGNVDVIGICEQDGEIWKRTKTIYLNPGEIQEVEIEFPEIKRFNFEPTFSATALVSQ